MKPKVNYSTTEPVETIVEEQPVVEDAVLEVVEEPVIEKVEAEIVTKGVVTAKLLNIRKGPGKEFDPMGTLSLGEEIEYTVENDEWLKLTNRVGYVMKQFIR